MRATTDVLLCVTFASLTILGLWLLLLLLVTGKLVPGNALQQAVEHAIKGVFGDPQAYSR